MSFPGNRRQADRRKADRRRPPVSTSEDGWFSAWGDPGKRGLVSRGADSSLLEADPEVQGDSHFIAREAKRLVSTEGAALPRSLSGSWCGSRPEPRPRSPSMSGRRQAPARGLAGTGPGCVSLSEAPGPPVPH